MNRHASGFLASRRRSGALAAATLGLFLGCSDAQLVSPSDIDAGVVASLSAGATQITVLDWNLYVGTDVDAVIGALVSPDPTDDLPALLAALETFQETDYPARAEAVADEIAKARPHVVGLQEVSILDVDLSALGIPVQIDVDFLAILQAALASRGLDYQVGAIVQNISATPLPGITLLDHDALLVDAERVTVLSSAGQNFANNIGPVAPGVSLVRGWVAVTADVHGEVITFVNTHLEAGPGEGLSLLRAAQATELVTAIGPAVPVVMMGDFNDTPGSSMHQVVSGAGFTDMWAALRPAVAGLTCCHLPNLSDLIAPFTQRIDYVFTRGVGHLVSGLQGQISLVGVRPADRLPGPVHPLWPSDHAGIVAGLLQAPVPGLAVVAWPE